MYQSRLYKACELSKVELIPMLLKRAGHINIRERINIVNLLTKNNQTQAVLQVFDHVHAPGYKLHFHDVTRMDLFLKAAIDYNRPLLLKGIIEKLSVLQAPSLYLLGYTLKHEKWEMAHILIPSDMSKSEFVNYLDTVLELNWHAFSQEFQTAPRPDEPNGFSPIGILNHIINTHFRRYPEQQARLKSLYAAILVNDEEFVIDLLSKNSDNFKVMDHFTFLITLACGQVNLTLKLIQNHPSIVDNNISSFQNVLLRAVAQNNQTTVKFALQNQFVHFKEIRRDRLNDALYQSKSFEMIQIVLEGLYAGMLPFLKHQLIVSQAYLADCFLEKDDILSSKDIEICYAYVKHYDFSFDFLVILFKKLPMLEIIKFLELPNCPIHQMSQQDFEKILLASLTFGDLDSIEYLLSKNEFIQLGAYFYRFLSLESGLNSLKIFNKLQNDSRFDKDRLSDRMTVEVSKIFLILTKDMNVDAVRELAQHGLLKTVVLHPNQLNPFYFLFVTSHLTRLEPKEVCSRKLEILDLILKEVSAHDLQMSIRQNAPCFTKFSLDMYFVSNLIHHFEIEVFKTICLSKRFGLPSLTHLGDLPVLTFSSNDSFDYLSNYTVQLLQLHHAICEIISAYEEDEHPNLVDMRLYNEQLYLAYQTARDAFAEKLQNLARKTQLVSVELEPTQALTQRASAPPLLFSARVSTQMGGNEEPSISPVAFEAPVVSEDSAEFEENLKLFIETTLDRVAGAIFSYR